MRRPSRSTRRSRASLTIPVIVAFLLLLGATPAFADFAIRGRGYGHGIGMSQYGAKGMAQAGFTYDRILAHYYQKTTLGSIASEPVVRVALHRTDTPSGYWTVRGNNADIWVDHPGRTNSTSNFASGGYLVLPKGYSYTIRPDGSTTNIRILRHDGVVMANIRADWVHVWERDTTKPRYSGLLQVFQSSGPFNYYNVLYPGSIKFERSATSKTLLHARNYVYLEDYVKSVVPRESPSSWPIEALKAQSVAARSYAHVGLPSSGSFDVWCTTSSQVYNGWGVWDATYGNVRHNDDPTTSALEGDWKSDSAVAATRLQLVKYGTTTVKTYFFSTSGGHTESIENSPYFADPGKPYYTGVPDPYERSAGSSKYLWEFYYTPAQARANLATELTKIGSSTQLPATIADMRVSGQGVSGRVTELQVIGTDGKVYTLAGKDIRAVRNALCGGLDIWFWINPETYRIAGASRYDTAVSLSNSGAFPSASSVVIASGSSFPDALSAAGLAGALDAPVLLVKENGVPVAVGDEIKRLGATKAYVIGGTNAVGDEVISQLRGIPALSATGRVERVAGSDRYATAAQVAYKIKAVKGLTSLPQAVVVSGATFADAVAASPFVWRKDLPVLLVNTSGAPKPTTDAIRALGVKTAYVVGGSGVVPNSTLTQVSSAGATPVRIAEGANRYDTAAKLADYMVANHGFSWDRTSIASGESLVDAIAGGSFAGKWNGPILFSRTHSTPTETLARLQLNKNRIRYPYLLGGESALGTVVEARVEVALD